jgi:hypothetical protein
MQRGGGALAGSPVSLPPLSRSATQSWPPTAGRSSGTTTPSSPATIVRRPRDHRPETAAKRAVGTWNATCWLLARWTRRLLRWRCPSAAAPGPLVPSAAPSSGPPRFLTRRPTPPARSETELSEQAGPRSQLSPTELARQQGVYKATIARVGAAPRSARRAAAAAAAAAPRDRTHTTSPARSSRARWRPAIGGSKPRRQRWTGCG